MIIQFVRNPIVHGAITGLFGAAAVDLHAFLTWRTVKDFSQWDWRTAVLRWAQGAVTGALAGASLVGVGA